MNKLQFMIVVAVALVAGLIGGVISDRLAMATGKKVIEADVIKARLIEAKSMETLSLLVRDRAGKSLRGVWSGTGMSLYDQKGVARLIIGVGSNGSSIFLFDTKQIKRASFGVGKKGDAKLLLFDDHGAMRATLAIDKNGPIFSLNDENGEPRTSSGIINGRAGFFVANAMGDLIWTAP